MNQPRPTEQRRRAEVALKQTPWAASADKVHDAFLELEVAAPAESIFEHARRQWDPRLFSDPNHHDPENFQYVIHALTSVCWSDRIANALRQFEGNLVEGWMSTSVVGTGKVATYQPEHSRVALILEVPMANVFAAAPFDMASRNPRNYAGQPTEEYLDVLLHRHGIKHPRELLTGRLNEVAVAVKTSEGKLKVKGLAFLAQPGWLPGAPLFRTRDPQENAQFVDTVNQVAAELGWPTIVLPRTV